MAMADPSRVQPLSPTPTQPQELGPMEEKAGPLLPDDVTRSTPMPDPRDEDRVRQEKPKRQGSVKRIRNTSPAPDFPEEEDRRKRTEQSDVLPLFANDAPQQREAAREKHGREPGLGRNLSRSRRGGSSDRCLSGGLSLSRLGDVMFYARIPRAYWARKFNAETPVRYDIEFVAADFQPFGGDGPLSWGGGASFASPSPPSQLTRPERPGWGVSRK
ncbi:hypothetical protein VTK73DRAFT_8571 [Phialemonium thermophilum]|uniref:Uncharacterized protein n=1 Tax=Phialemonium thermophilum TaxID=223376 RepID=A0ABR3W7U5_9PEZI